MRKVLRTGVFVWLAFAAPYVRGEGLAGSLQIKGSDTMVNLVQAWAEEFAKKNPDVNIAVTGGGSGTGIAALIDGTCDIACSSRDIKEKEIAFLAAKGFKTVCHTVALDGVLVAVNPRNPVKELTIQQLSAIFTAEVTDWKEVGGENSAIVALSREVSSGTYFFFKERVLRKGDPKGMEEFAPECLLMPSSQAICDEVKQNPHAIGYYGLGYLDEKQKAIHVADEGAEEFVGPTIENVASGVYPISRPLVFYTRGNAEGLAKAFIEFAISPRGQEIVEEMDFVPLKK